MTFLDHVLAYLAAHDHFATQHNPASVEYWDAARAMRKALARLRRAAEQMEAIKRKEA